MAGKPYHKFSELGDWFACLRKLETWLILGMPDGGDNLDGMRRVFLPSHGFAVCWRFWVEADITLYVDELKVDDDAKRFVFPYTCDQIKVDAGHSDMALFVCPKYVFTDLFLRAKFDELPVKTGRIFKIQLLQSDIMVAGDIECKIHGVHSVHLSAISLARKGVRASSTVFGGGRLLVG